MFDAITARKRRSRQSPTINVAPLIDMVFVLLIFFMVTTTFVRDRGIEVTRPHASASRVIEPKALRISILAGGAVFIDGDEVKASRLTERVADWAAGVDKPSVILIPDERTPSARLVQALDAVKIAGVENVAIATRERR